MTLSSDISSSCDNDSSTASVDSVASRKKLNKSLRFGEVEIRDMPMELGEHPPSLGGAPVTIGWEAMEVRRLSIDLYEIHRSDYKTGVGNELLMDPRERAEILIGAGYTFDDLILATEAADDLKKKRTDSLNSQKMEFLHVAAESARRKLSRALTKPRVSKAA